jgi:hypothetical protein
VLAGDVRTGQKADLPDQFSYALGADIVLGSRLSAIADLFGQRVINSPRLSSRITTRTGVAGTATLPDISFTSESYWASAASFGLKGNLAPRMLMVFNLRFALGDSGLTDRMSPLVGVEWAF